MALFSTSGDYTDASCLIFFWLGETLEFVAKPNNEVHVPHSPERIFIYFFHVAWIKIGSLFFSLECPAKYMLALHDVNHFINLSFKF